MGSKALDSWEHRVARMHPQTSKMELEILKRLKTDSAIRESGWRIEFQKPFCLVQTTPDFYLAKGERRIGVYLDGAAAHKNRGDRDEELRDLLEKRHHVKPLTIRYACYSKPLEDRIFNTIKKVLESTIG